MPFFSIKPFYEEAETTPPKIDLRSQKLKKAILILALCGFSLSALVAQTEASPSAAKLIADALRRQWTSEFSDYSAARKAIIASAEFIALRKAKDTSGWQSMLNSLQPPDRQHFAARALKAADEYSGQKGVGDLLCFALMASMNSEEQAGQLSKRLITDHHDEPAVMNMAVRYLENMVVRRKFESLLPCLSDIIEKCADVGVKAAGLKALGSYQVMMGQQYLS